ncbi:MAG TPA: hypothetical protein VM533_18575 [Fimbriiglobus sp.]|nr:hypothetical protein [Fimbriiglobus sp.]
MSPNGTWSRRLRAAILVLGSAAALLLVPLPSGWQESWHGRLLDLAHVPLFAGLVIALRIILGLPIGWSVGTVIALAGLAEVAQEVVGRAGGWHDFLRGMFGALAAGAGLLSWEQRRKPIRAAAYVVAAIGFVAWPVVELAPYFIDAVEGNRAFPVLAAFDSERELRRWDCKQATITLVDDPQGGGSLAGRLELLPGSVEFSEANLWPVVRDFRGYRWLCYSLWVPHGPLELALSVRGGPLQWGHTTNFQVVRTFPEGEHIVRLDLEEVRARARPVPMDLSEVKRLRFFNESPSEIRTFFVRRIWLE